MLLLFTLDPTKRVHGQTVLLKNFFQPRYRFNVCPHSGESLPDLRLSNLHTIPYQLCAALNKQVNYSLRHTTFVFETKQAKSIICSNLFSVSFDGILD